MKKSDLRTGMQVENRNGNRKVVLLDTIDGSKLITINSTMHGDFIHYNDDLTHHSCRDLDIMKVYSSEFVYKVMKINFKECDLIWQREIKIEISVIINGKESSLKDISEETLLNIRNK